MQEDTQTERNHALSPLFKQYVAQLAVRAMVFVIAVILFVIDPAQLDITTRLGIADGFDFVDLSCLLVALDLMSKLRPHAKIAMGSRKQYGEFHVPTARMFSGGTKELREEAGRLIEKLIREAPSIAEQMAGETSRAIRETTQGIKEAGRQFAYSIDILRMLPWTEADLTTEERIRERIRSDRMHEVMPVIVFWVTFNVAVGLLLDKFNLLSPSTVLLWVLFYFLFDMISVVLWCPLQLVFMRNRCCTTCQIFNWDGIMTTTPLFAVWCWFSWVLIPLALVVLVRWELSFMQHPERFDEKTNASLQCANCADKLCHLRGPLTPRRRV